MNIVKLAGARAGDLLAGEDRDPGAGGRPVLGGPPVDVLVHRTVPPLGDAERDLGRTAQRHASGVLPLRAQRGAVPGGLHGNPEPAAGARPDRGARRRRGVRGLYGIVAQPSAAGYATGPTSASGLNRLAGTIGDPNQLASVLVVGFTLSIALAASSARSSAVRLMAAAAATITLLGIFFTVSRGGLFALGAAMVATVLVARATLPGCQPGATRGGDRDRVLHGGGSRRGATGCSRRTAAAGGPTSGRSGGEWWKRTRSRASGPGNFPVSSIHYLLVEPGALQQDKYVVDEPHVAHNIYLGFLAELGVVGLCLFLLIVAGSLRAAVLAARRFARLGDGEMELITRAVIVAILALLAADFFLSDQYSKVLWLLLAIGPALLAVSRRIERRPAPT